jgi:hypothetical protein
LGFLGYGYFNNVHFVNLGIGLILIGWVILSFSYEKYLKYDISSSIFNDYMDLIGKLIKSLDIKTGGIVIPPRENLKNGGIFLPLNRNFKINFGLLDDNVLFVNSDSKNEMGILFSPLGRSFINTLKKYDDVQNIEYIKNEKDIGDIGDAQNEYVEEYLNYALNLFQLGDEVNVYHSENAITISYKINDNKMCGKLQNENLCRKCPCPICGFIILSLAKSLGKVLEIDDITEENKNIIIKLTVLDKI